MIKDLFFDNVILDDCDKENANIFLNSKGYIKHLLIKEYLISNLNISIVDYSAIATTYRYDKRLRNVLFKYISCLEEYYRGKILDLYYYDINQSFWTKKVKRLIDSYKNLDKALEKTDFRELINQIKQIELLSNCLPKINKLNKNILALIDLRNAVMHNKLLILFNDYQVCYDENDLCSATLTSNIKNLVHFLPNGPKEKCIKEINACCLDRNEYRDTKWNLPEQIIVKI